ncbi:MAG: T9SS type A sorting domain-containing protein [Chitinophagaceae bacterium]|nr:T9SS type A sorting domain-containing protein [Chitinophagaceae bacterium]
MKKTFTLNFPVFLVLMLVGISGQAQCPAGYTAAELNWDHLDFLPSNNTRYSTYYPSAAFPYNQNFAMGTRRVNFSMAPAANITLNGENGVNTAHALSYATAGDDVQFTTAAATSTTITMTFDANVDTASFSLFDIDASQRVNVVATNAAGVSQIIRMVTVVGTSGIVVGGSGTISATATGPATAYAGTDNRGTINVRVQGAARQIIITLSNAAGDVWLSDIDACITGTFPANYQQISRPFTGQPQYVVTVVNNNIYYVDPTNGRGYFLFNEPAHNRLNSLAYDPYDRVVYYTFSLTANPTPDKTLKKYDVDAKTISVVIPNVNTFGIPTYESGVESGAATFYNGSLYLGIEGYTGTSGTGSYAAGRKSTIWKIDFDAAGNAVPPATQVWGVTADDGTNAQNIHDWSDFAISNGVLTDFDGSQSGQVDFYSFNLMTGNRVNYVPAGVIPRQVSIGWDERIYNVDAAISLYNGTTGVGTLNTIFAPLGPTIPTGASASWGDAAGPYRPFLDFGDAPATYDPDPWSPACHDTLTPTVANVRTRLKLGADEDVEWLKRGFTTVEDNFEDGLAFVPIFSPISSSYLARVTVTNNTGSPATLCAWLDFNGNGFFNPGEGITPITVPSAAAPQSFWMSWPSAPSPLVTGSYTYLRIRITSSAYNMTTANSTGYYDMGEVEDYRVIVDNTVLQMNLSEFDAAVDDNVRVKMNWSGNEGPGFLGYDVERSTDGTNWEHFAYVEGVGHDQFQEYKIVDHAPYRGTSYYRLRLNQSNGPVRYSNIRPVKIVDMSRAMVLFPNPATDHANLVIAGGVRGKVAQIFITDIKGNRLAEQKVTLADDYNIIALPIQRSWIRGMYFVHMRIGESTTSAKLVLNR